jgi:hypothetical protein
MICPEIPCRVCKRCCHDRIEGRGHKITFRCRTCWVVASILNQAGDVKLAGPWRGLWGGTRTLRREGVSCRVSTARTHPPSSNAASIRSFSCL